MNNLTEIVKQYSVTANKSLGQNFIFDHNILKKIAESQLTDSICLEIGCGPGGLTKELAKVCKKVIGIELDEKFSEIYKEYLTEDNIKIIFADFMKIDLKELFNEQINKRFSVCANLPYYITTPIIMRLLDSDLPIDKITVLVQKEVADRIVSEPNSKQYGVLSVMTQARGTAKKLFDLQPGVFTPPPSVISSLIDIEIKKNLINSDLDEFRKCVRIAFSSRRKQLKNNISAGYNITKEEAVEIFKKINIDEQARAENLSVDSFDKLTERLSVY